MSAEHARRSQSKIEAYDQNLLEPGVDRQSPEQIDREYDRLLSEIRTLEDDAMKTWLPWRRNRMREQLNNKYNELSAIRKAFVEARKHSKTPEYNDQQMTTQALEASAYVMLNQFVQPDHSQPSTPQALEAFPKTTLDQLQHDLDLQIVVQLDESDQLDKQLYGQTTEKLPMREELLATVIESPRDFGVSEHVLTRTEGEVTRSLDVNILRDQERCVHVLKAQRRDYVAQVTRLTQQQKDLMYALNVKRSKDVERSLQGGSKPEIRKNRTGLARLFEAAKLGEVFGAHHSQIEIALVHAQSYEHFNEDTLKTQIRNLGEVIVQYNNYARKIEDMLDQYDLALSRNSNSEQFTTKLSNTEIQALQDRRPIIDQQLAHLRKQRYFVVKALALQQSSAERAVTMANSVINLEQAGQELNFSQEQQTTRQHHLELVTIQSTDFVGIDSDDLEIATESLTELRTENVQSLGA